LTKVLSEQVEPAWQFFFLTSEHSGLISWIVERKDQYGYLHEISATIFSSSANIFVIKP
jgi:hypothetical protein